MSLGHKINKSPLLSAKDAETLAAFVLSKQDAFQHPKTHLIASTRDVKHEIGAGEEMEPLHTVDDYHTTVR